MRKYKIRRADEETECSYCGYPLFIDDTALMSSDEKHVFCSKACAGTEARLQAPATCSVCSERGVGRLMLLAGGRAGVIFNLARCASARHAFIQSEATMNEHEIEKRLAEARRLYVIADRERGSAEGNREYALDGFRETCKRLLTIIESQRREIERLERECAPLVKPQPKGVKAGCFDV